MSDINQAPRGQQYGQRAATEAALEAVPIPEQSGPDSAPPAELPAAAPDPMSAARGFNPPTGLMNMPAEQLPPPGNYQPQIPQANRDAMRMMPMLPGLQLRAAQPGASQSFRNWLRRLTATIPPEVSMRDLNESGGPPA